MVLNVAMLFWNLSTSALTILNGQHIPPTYDMLRFFLHQSDLLAVEPNSFNGGFEVPEPDLAEFDRLI